MIRFYSKIGKADNHSYIRLSGNVSENEMPDIDVFVCFDDFIKIFQDFINESDRGWRSWINDDVRHESLIRICDVVKERFSSLDS